MEYLRAKTLHKHNYKEWLSFLDKISTFKSRWGHWLLIFFLTPLYSSYWTNVGVWILVMTSLVFIVDANTLLSNLCYPASPSGSFIHHIWVFLPQYLRSQTVTIFLIQEVLLPWFLDRWDLYTWGVSHLYLLSWIICSFIKSGGSKCFLGLGVIHPVVRNPSLWITLKEAIVLSFCE